MAISYELAPIPKWYIADLTGKPLGSGSMYTYSNLDKTTFKYVFQDPAGNFPWTDPILFDENGSQGPFYWEVDPDNADDTYYIEVYDANGVLQWTIENFSPPGGGGGSIITTALDLENLIVNNVMWRNTGTTAFSPGVLSILAPGAHSALANYAANSNGLYTGPDIYFIKNNASATDTIAFPRFILGTTPFTGDVTTVDYLNYTCSIAGSAETIKCVQYPITQNIQNLSNQNVTLTIWARGNTPSAGNTLTLQVLQFTGNGGSPQPSATTIAQTLTLTSSWAKYVIQFTIPDVTTLTPVGSCGNDALFFQVQFPLNVTCNIDFQKPCMYLGNISPTEDYHTYDMIDSVINSPRTGAISQGYFSSFAGYVPMNDGSIGSAASAATTRANLDTFPLFNLIWNSVIDTWAPVSGGRGASAVADFAANKTLTLTKQLGRALAESGSGSGLTTRALGETLGEETHVLTIPEMPAHTHNTTFFIPSAAVLSSGGGFPPTELGNTATSSTGGDGAHNNMQPTTFYNFYIKL